MKKIILLTLLTSNFVFASNVANLITCTSANGYNVDTLTVSYNDRSSALEVEVTHLDESIEVYDIPSSLDFAEMSLQLMELDLHLGISNMVYGTREALELEVSIVGDVGYAKSSLEDQYLDCEWSDEILEWYEEL